MSLRKKKKEDIVQTKRRKRNTNLSRERPVLTLEQTSSAFRLNPNAEMNFKMDGLGTRFKLDKLLVLIRREFADIPEVEQKSEVSST